MRKRQQFFLSINRIVTLLYVPLSIALGIFYLFTGDLYHAVLSWCTLIWLFLPYVIHRIFHLRYAQLLLTLYFLFVLISYSGGIVLSFRYRIAYYDQMIHVFSGFFFAVAASAAFCKLMKQRSLKKNLGFSNLFCFCFSLAMGALWELLQIAVAFWTVKSTVSISATAWDIIACLCGIAIYCVITGLYAYKGIHTYPLYAIEDFAALNIKSTVQILDT